MLTRRLKLTALSEAMLRDKEMGCLLGGSACCFCSCLYEGQSGGSTSSQNSVANSALGMSSPMGCNSYFYCGGNQPVNYIPDLDESYPA